MDGGNSDNGMRQNVMLGCMGWGWGCLCVCVGWGVRMLMCMCVVRVDHGSVWKWYAWSPVCMECVYCSTSVYIG